MSDFTYQPTAIETAILNQIAHLRSEGLTVHVLPNTSGEYQVALKATDKGVITLVVKSETAGAAHADPAMQLLSRTAMVYLRLRNIQDEAGADEVKEAIRKGFLDYRPPGCTTLRWAQGWQFKGRTDNFWLFEAGLSFSEVYQEPMVTV